MINFPIAFHSADFDYRRVSAGFAADTSNARKILAIEIAGLGDIVHSLPALWALRQGYPKAELHCLVQEGNASLLGMAPWIDRVIPYRRFSSVGYFHHLQIAREIRAQRYDVAVDLIGADCSSLIAGISGATRKLIRRPGSSRPRSAWRWFGTDIMHVPFRTEPMYQQRLSCVRQAGFTTPAATFQLAEPQKTIPVSVAWSEAVPYIHVSPYTKLSRKELPPSQMAQLVEGLMRSFPGHRLVLSCSAKQRELAAMTRLLADLPSSPWQVFAGTLDIPQLYSLIQSAALHIGGDTGTIHLAWLADTPTVSWFRKREGLVQWAPQGARHALVHSIEDEADYLYGVDNDTILTRAHAALSDSA
ncbi:MAG: lipopolysaccharide heptosyltransferase [Hydrocarboniphaga sp.]|uniref:glycosyltransferase family 9 protein n=1 Tax=Hydrocarboniphaga sp. TaxID=2033016 RepID=UPI0026038DA7|nr:glycosyltransferase family 9 protein [Hydrocarboniphaga sp.]MDB5972565.1 lipopolysaccharide heptosyltransferase [Hydrocarboniphaga sp.]